MLSNSFLLVIVDRNEIKSNLSKKKNRFTSKTDYYMASQTDKKLNQLNQIKESKNLFETSFKPMLAQNKKLQLFRVR